MRVNALKTILVSLLIIFSLPRSFSQIPLNSCGINLTIPTFKKDSVFSDSEQILIRKKVLIPIQQSKSNFEIRLYSYPYFSPGKTIVIKCNGNKIEINHYGLGFQPTLDRTRIYKNSKNLGPLPENPGMDVLVFYENQLKLEDYTWQDFFSKLIDNYFFDLVPQTEIQKKVKTAHSNIEIIGESALYIQIKVGNNFRNMKFSGSFGDAAQDIPEYRYLSNIYSILSKIK
ncbi:hypothetical protein ABDJ41_22395 [Pedobacter sp. ASV1-7]|uniref:hypothetical protein n=1 Tax=Pedobacter sp. ASV1-7 TaxID=3145237 RepID=UPI0032E937EE